MYEGKTFLSVWFKCSTAEGDRIPRDMNAAWDSKALSMKSVGKTVSDVIIRIQGNQTVISGNMVPEEEVEHTLTVK